MSQERALAEARRLADAIRARGVTVSIELQTGANGAWMVDRTKVAILSHHTASRRSQGLTPCLGIVKRGRSDVPGPLANGYGGWDLVYRIITMGIANHSGAGGPLTIAGVTIPQDNGRWYMWGTEFEGGLDAADFTPAYREFMARANAGILDYLGLPVARAAEHKTWAPKRKIDRLGYTAASGQQEIVTLGGKPGAIAPAAPSAAWSYRGSPGDAHAPGSRTLTIGACGTDVAWVQALVGSLQDGKYGPLTVDAVKTWQGRKGLLQDGVFGPISWGVALGTTTPTPAPTARNSAAARPYAPGAVARIQGILNAAGYDAGAEDDDYGPRTKAAVDAYQRSQIFGGLVADGDWGPATEAHYAWTARLQARLNEYRTDLPRLVVDGDFRALTRRRVEELQRRNGLFVDGEPGPRTCAFLGVPTHP